MREEGDKKKEVRAVLVSTAGQPSSLRAARALVIVAIVRISASRSVLDVGIGARLLEVVAPAHRTRGLLAR